MTTSDPRRDPEEILRWVKTLERKEKRGRLKVFLGYASGVGKSFRLLDEGRRRKERGQDVVVGALQARRPAEAEELAAGIEDVSDHGDLDAGAVLRRRPGVCLVDELAHDNPPGSRRPTRWEDVADLLDAGITVVTAVNIQHVEGLQDVIAAVNGDRPGETVPEAFLRTADEIVVVDASPDMLRGRREGAANGDSIDAGPDAHPARARRLNELRQLALLFAAEIVDQQLEACIRETGGERVRSAQERILVCVTPDNDGERMIASGCRNAERFHGDMFVAYVAPDAEWSALSAEDRATVQGRLALARSVGAHAEVLVGSDEVHEVLEFARAHRITQIFVGHSARRWWQRFFSRGTLTRLIRDAEGIDVRVFPNRAVG